jgi:aminoglycoside phosphotransferase (APT) family kinase protein
MSVLEIKIPDSILQWVIEAVDCGGTQVDVVSAERLKGGISSAVHSVSLRVNGKSRDVVLRQFDNAQWVTNEPDIAFREAESLRVASHIAGVRTPDLIAVDRDGSRCGKPTVLMSRLDGNVILEPADRSRWLEGLAQALARIHRSELGIMGAGSIFPWTFAPYCDAATHDASSWSSIPERWKEAVEVVTSSQPMVDLRFIHRDFHPANVLWSNDEVSGVVDWVNGCMGPAGIDVGHCRVNLSQLYDVETADEFLSLYMKHAGSSFQYNPYWDIVTLIDYSCEPPGVYQGWVDLGVSGLTDQLMAKRLDDYLIRLLERAG